MRRKQGLEKQYMKSLEEDLFNDDVIAMLVEDDDFAHQLYRALCNNEFTRYDDEGRRDVWSCTWRYSGSMVADLRGLDEDYMDFYCSGGEGHVSELIHEHLFRLGWKHDEIKVYD